MATVTWVSITTTATGAVVKLRLDDATDADLRVSLSSDLSDPTDFEGVEGNDDVWTFTVTGLEAHTRYYWDAIVDEGSGAAAADLGGQFRTKPSGATLGKGRDRYRIGFGNCAARILSNPSGNQVSNSLVWTNLLQMDIDEFIHLGDRHYEDITTEGAGWLGQHRAAYQHMYEMARQAELRTKVATAETWDDHCFGGNGSTGSYAGKADASQAYAEYMATPTLPGQTDGVGPIYHAYSIGTLARVVMLDVFYNYNPGMGGTVLGATQKAWLLNEIATATEDILIIGMANSWIDGGNFEISDDTKAEREDIGEALVAAGRNNTNCIILHGDAHAIQLDDGTNSNYDTASEDKGPVVACGGPIEQSNSQKGGTYSEGKISASRMQFGILDIFADGTFEVHMFIAGSHLPIEVDQYPSDATPILPDAHTFREAFTGADDSAIPATFTLEQETIESTGNEYDIEQNRMHLETSSGSFRRFKHYISSVSLKNLLIWAERWRIENVTLSQAGGLVARRHDDDKLAYYASHIDAINDKVVVQSVADSGNNISPTLTERGSAAKSIEANTDYDHKFLVLDDGESATDLKARVWGSYAAEPATWDVEVEGDANGPQAAGHPGVRYFNEGNVNSVGVRIDALTIWDASDATLQALSAIDADGNAVSVSPSFDPEVTSYTASVDNDVDEIWVLPILSMSAGSVTVGGTAVDFGKRVRVALSEGANAISIVATAPDGMTTETYTWTVTRAAAEGAGGGRAARMLASGII